MRRVALIAFQSLMALGAFFWAAYSIVQLQDPDLLPSVVWIARFRIVCLFIGGTFFTVYALRNVWLLVRENGERSN